MTNPKEFFFVLHQSLCDCMCIFCDRGTRDYRRKVRKNLSNYDYRSESVSIQDVIADGKKDGAEKIVIGGNEPLTHPNIIKIVEFSKTVGFTTILIQTSGLRFSNENFVAALVKRGLTDVMLPIYGSTKKIHDFIVGREGSFDLLISALKNLKLHDIGISFHTTFLIQNSQDITNMVDEFNLSHVIFPFPMVNHFNFLRSDTNNPFQLYKKICPRISDFPKAHADLLTIKIPCILGKYKPKKNPSLERHSSVGNKNLDEHPSNIKIKPDKCLECEVSDYCDGVHPYYLEIYGDNEFKPIITK